MECLRWNGEGRGEEVSLGVEILGSGSMVSGDIGGLRIVDEAEVAYYSVNAKEESQYQWRYLLGMKSAYRYWTFRGSNRGSFSYS